MTTTTRKLATYGDIIKTLQMAETSLNFLWSMIMPLETSCSGISLIYLQTLLYFAPKTQGGLLFWN